MTSRSFKSGDSVGWNSSGGASVGKIVKKLTSRTRIKRHQVAATEHEPEYLVRSDASGKLAAHKPESLKKRG